MTVRRGFTVVEMTVALLLGTLLLAGAWLLVDALDRQHRVSREATGLISTTAEVDTELTGALRRAGQGMFSSWNWAAILADSGHVDGVEADTLLLFEAAASASRVSAQSCPSGGSCVLAVGDLSGTLQPEDLVVVGAPDTGVRLLQVTAVDTVSLACGADCGVVSTTCTDTAVADLAAPVVTGSVMHSADGTTTTSQSGPCEQSYYPDGRWCTEAVASQTVGEAWDSFCWAAPSPAQPYTEVTYSDRTAHFDVPSLSMTTLRSGANGVPQVLLQPVTVSRYWVDHSLADRPTLVKQIEYRSDRTFGPPLPVTAGIERFRVEVLPADTNAFVRGRVVSDAQLSLGSTNPNLVRAPGPLADSLVSSYRFIRSYRSTAGVRILYRASGAVGERGSEAPPTESLEIVVATPAILGGGSPAAQ